MKLNKRLSLFVLSAFTSLSLAAQQTPTPGYFMFPIKPGERNYLSGSMGEIRSNHFHGGLDIKTDQRIGLDVHAAADGYISRVKQSTYGYGNIIYVTHPNGLTTTYAHLSAYYEPLANYMLQQQYEKQTFELELFPEPSMFPVKKGDVIALSGNTGGSGGPHLHFEIRDDKDKLYNPLRYKFSEIIDTTPPDIFSLGIQTLNIHGRVNNEFGRAEFTPVKKGNSYIIADTVYAHGLLGLELQTTDRYDGASNRNGTQEVTLYANNKPAYHHLIEAVPFELSRQVSQHINYEMYKRRGRTFQKAFVDDGNDLPLYNTNARQGKLSIKPDSVYQIRIEAKDSYDNTSTLSFIIKGQKPAFTKTLAKSVKQPQLGFELVGNVLQVNATDTSSTPRNVELFLGDKRYDLVPSYTKNSTSVCLYDLRAGVPDSISFCGISRNIPEFDAVIPSGKEISYSNSFLHALFSKESLYDTLYFQTKKEGDVYTIGDYFTPLLKAIKVTIAPETPITDKSKAAVYFLGNNGRGRGYQGGTWNGNRITFTTRNMGKFRVLEDVKAPTIRLLSKSKDQIKFRIGDDLSGINSFNAYINGQWLLMKYEHKTATIYSEKINKNISLSGEVVLKVKDNAGNEATYTTTI
ncbi:M23 family metallopeptidase [Pontibacter silvestris]|uniref:M23 family metallopeptidase n=1 Tax=Pontibacter silvestris TaxID=2305183 RepID=A0ABW4X373_9BACT|nr:M23 family metallopeptidase [Pontibacter silvestris]MCC9134935.1 M23 family metallopeptidase [Pontibacter silvestris]